VLLVLQIVPYFMTGFESVAKGSEEARMGFDPRDFGRAITLAVVAGSAFYVLVLGAVSFVYPWRDLVSNHLGTEVAFARAFGSPTIARLILVAAFLSLFKVMNGNFMAATRMLFALGRRGMVHPALGAVHPRYGTPGVAIVLMAGLTAAAAFLGDALLVPVTEVGSLAAGVGWCAACVALVWQGGGGGKALAITGALVSLAIVAMKVIPGIPGSFTAAEWIAFAAWCALGALFWTRR
jgi:amino acid transporter